MLRRSPALGVGQGVLLERGRRPSHDAVGAHPSQHLDREAVEGVGHARGVVAGIEDDEDVAVAEVPAAHLDQVCPHTAELGGCDLGDVVLGAETDGVQGLAPGRPARFESGDVRPSKKKLCHCSHISRAQRPSSLTALDTTHLAVAFSAFCRKARSHHFAANFFIVCPSSDAGRIGRSALSDPVRQGVQRRLGLLNARSVQATPGEIGVQQRFRLNGGRMNDGPATERLARELKKLQNAGGLSLTQIGELGKKQIPPVKWSKSKLSQWFSGKNVPADGRPFNVLVEVLEARAQQRSGTPKRGLLTWREMRDAADQERRAAGSGGSAPSSGGQTGEADPVVRLVTQVGEFMREAHNVAEAVARYELSPRRDYPTKTVTVDGWTYDVPVEPVPANPRDVEELAWVDRALVGVRAEADCTATRIPGLENHVRRVLAACNDLRGSCVSIDFDDDGRPESFYPRDLLRLEDALTAFKGEAAALRGGA